MIFYTLLVKLMTLGCTPILEKVAFAPRLNVCHRHTAARYSRNARPSALGLFGVLGCFHVDDGRPSSSLLARREYGNGFSGGLAVLLRWSAFGNIDKSVEYLMNYSSDDNYNGMDRVNTIAT